MSDGSKAGIVIIPFHTIRNVEIYPKPPKLPRFAIKNVRLIS